MRILVLHSQVPFARGGAEVLVDGLVAALAARGHAADVVRLPYRWYPPERLLGSVLAWRLLDLTEVDGLPVDLVVCTKFPTWAVKHPRKVLWLVHQHRQAYDLYGTPHSDFGPSPEDRSVREAVIQVDRIGIGECVSRFAISENVAERLKRYTGLAAEVLYPPVDRRELRAEAYAPFILSATRLDELKRVGALIGAWPMVSEDLRLIIASDGPLRREYEELARALDVAHRVDFVGRVSDDELARLFRTCRAVYYAPIDEDYGYVTVEAHAAGKPVVTAPDSGGVLEFVEHGVSGQITSLEPEALAAAIDVYSDTAVARSHGEQGQRHSRVGNWDTVIERLLEVART